MIKGSKDMDDEERSDHTGPSDESGSDSEDEVSGGEHVISSTEEYQPPYYEHIEENAYLFDKKKKINKEVRRMLCDCTYDADDVDFVGCGEDCLNRLLMIECNSRCSCGQFCSNKRFQQGCKVKVEVIKTENKGWGLKTLEDLDQNQFVMEYCGEVVSYKDFQERAERYDRENRRHYYFMTLRADEIIDATFRGNLSRFINHSCDSNCETQKWTVNGLLRIGFFTQRRIPAGTELTFDYQLQRYGKEAQVCYCEAPNCRGFIGGEKQTPLKNTVERIATPSTSSPRRRRKKRNIANDFDDLTLEDEVEKLLGEHRGLISSDQALKLSRLMVRAETMEQRVMLLKILQHTTDQSCLKGFLRYQGLSLLWSWMVDGGGKKPKLKKELMDTLRYLPIATKNQLEDSKVIKVVRKWAASTSPSGEVGSSSGQDSHGNSPADSECTAGTEDADEESHCLSKSLEKDKIKGGCIMFRRQCSNKDQSDDDSLDAEVAELTARKTGASATIKTNMVAESSGKSPDELSEDDGKSEDERLSENGDVGVALIANDLLKSWSSLKEVYRIPKKSATPAKQDRCLELSTTAASPAGSTDGDQLRTQVEQVNSPGKLDMIMQSLVGVDSSSPQPLMPRESGTPLVTQGVSTCSEETAEKSSEVDLPLVQGGDFSALEFNDVVEAISEETLTPGKHEAAQSVPPFTHYSERPQKQVTKTQMQTFGYQQRMSFNAEQGFQGGLQQKPGKSKKKKKKWMQNAYFQQQDMNMQGDFNFGHSNMNPQTNFGPQQGGPQWRAPPPPQAVQGVPRNYQGMQYFAGPTAGREQCPQPQNVGAGNFGVGGGNFSAQVAPPFSNFNVPPPNIPPSEFFRKVPPPNFQQQTPPVIPQPQQNVHVPPARSVPPPPLQASQPAYYPPAQPTPYTRLPPPPPYQASVSTPPPSHFLPGSAVPPPQNVLNAQPNQFPFNSPPLQPSIVPAQQVSVPSKVPVPVQQPLALSSSHVAPPPAAEPLSPQTRAVTSASSNTMECAPSEAEPCTPSPVKHKPTHLPPHWKTATDPQGKVYYYHALTRKTQWELPRWESTVSPSSEEEPPPDLTITQDTDIMSNTHSEIEEQTLLRSKGKKMIKTPSTPPGTPPESPTLAYTTAAADTTANRSGELLPVDGSSLGSSSLQQKVRELFRMKLSNVVVNCLNPFFKVDCKSGRITSSEDFKYLARKLTHGILMKELTHLKEEETLQCTDSVKIKTKEYIRSYMKKFGPVYKRT